MFSLIFNTYCIICSISNSSFHLLHKRFLFKAINTSKFPEYLLRFAKARSFENIQDGSNDVLCTDCCHRNGSYQKIDDIHEK